MLIVWHLLKNIIIKYKKDDNLYRVLEEIIDYYKSNSKVKIDIDFKGGSNNEINN